MREGGRGGGRSPVCGTRCQRLQPADHGPAEALGHPRCSAQPCMGIHERERPVWEQASMAVLVHWLLRTRQGRSPASCRPCSRRCQLETASAHAGECTAVFRWRPPPATSAQGQRHPRQSYSSLPKSSRMPLNSPAQPPCEPVLRALHQPRPKHSPAHLTTCLQGSSLVGNNATGSSAGGQGLGGAVGLVSSCPNSICKAASASLSNVSMAGNYASQARTAGKRLQGRLSLVDWHGKDGGSEPSLQLPMPLCALCSFLAPWTADAHPSRLSGQSWVWEADSPCTRG